MNQPIQTSDLRGRFEARQPGSVRHLFGTLGALAGDLEPFVVRPRINWSGGGEKRLWLVGTDASQLIRVDRVAPGLTPVSRVQIETGQGVPLVQNPQVVPGRSQLQVQVDIQRDCGTHRFFLDSNQWIEVYASCVDVALYAPDNFIEIGAPGAQSSPPPVREGSILDVLMGAQILAIEQSQGRASATFTTSVDVPAATDVSIPIPPYAHAVTISQRSFPVAADAVFTQSVNIGGMIDLGAIPLVNLSSGRVELNNADHLWCDLDPAVNRRFAFTWEIRP